MSANHPAGRESADSCRTKRVAQLNDALIRIYRVGQKADAQEFAEAQTLIDEIRTCLDGVESAIEDESAARERERRSQALHGENTKDAG